MLVQFIRHIESSMILGFKPLTREQFFSLAKRLEAGETPRDYDSTPEFSYEDWKRRNGVSN